MYTSPWMRSLKIDVHYRGLYHVDRHHPLLRFWKSGTEEFMISPSVLVLYYDMRQWLPTVGVPQHPLRLNSQLLLLPSFRTRTIKLPHVYSTTAGHHGRVANRSFELDPHHHWLMHYLHCNLDMYILLGLVYVPDTEKLIQWPSLHYSRSLKQGPRIINRDAKLYKKLVNTIYDSALLAKISSLPLIRSVVGLRYF